MRREHLLLFDDQVVSSTTAYTRAEHNERLGLYDQVAVHAVVDNTAGSANGTLTVTLEHAADARLFVSKSTLVAGGTVTLGAISNLVGSDGGGSPTLEFARLAIQLGGSVTSAHVRVWGTLRDAGV